MSKSEKIEKLKERLENELGDKLTNIEMDVTSSFLNGRICSPLLATANNTANQARATAGTILNTMGQAGLYITKDGLQYDPSVAIDAAGNIVNSAINLSASEIIRLKDKAIREITYVPDPSIIMKKAIAYFAYDLQFNIDFNDLLSFKNEDDVQEENKDNLVKNTHKKLQTFVDEKLPVISEKISYVTSTVNNTTEKITRFLSFGPDWVTGCIAEAVGDASYMTEQYLDEQTQKITDWKLEQYDKTAYAIGKSLTKKYEKLVKENLKDAHDRIEVEKSKIKLKAVALINKVNLAIMAKTGIKIPIDKVTPENLSKIKNAKDTAELISLAATSTPSNGPSDAPKNYSTEYINDLLSEVRKIAREYGKTNNKLINNNADEQTISAVNKQWFGAESIEVAIMNYLQYGNSMFEFDNTYSNIDELISAANELIRNYESEQEAEEEFDFMKEIDSYNQDFLNYTPNDTPIEI